MFTRNLMSRLISVHNSQLSQNADINRPNARYYSRIGNYIFRKYQKNAMQEMDFESNRKIPTFQAFLEYLVSESNSLRSNHWNINTLKCLPCDIDYDIIGHFETLMEDAKFILDSIGAGDLFPVWSSNRTAQKSTDNDLMIETFQHIPFELIRKVYKLYELDFQIFGYEFELKENGVSLIKLPPN